MSSLLRSVWLRRLVPIGFYTLLFIFLVLYLQSIDFSKLAQITLNWWYVLIACVLALCNRYVGAFTWLTILRTLGATGVQLNKQLIYVYAKAWLGRYIPGTAPWILGKIYFASEHGIAKQKLAVSSLLEGGLQIVTMLVFSLALLVFDRRLDVLGGGFKLLMIGVALFGIIVTMPAIYNRVVSRAYKLLRGKTIDAENMITRHTIMQGASLYLFDAIINGFALFFIAKAVDPSLSYHNIAFVMGAASLAGAASMLAVFAPSGLGVREGIQLVLFSLIMPKELALAVTIITRLWTVGIDFVFFALSRLIAGQSITKKE
jgi:uncharacterized membrane protein YbhN (UPF0104 family)